MSSPVLALTIFATVRRLAAAAASSRRSRPQARRAAPQRRRRINLALSRFGWRREGRAVEALPDQRGLAELARRRVAPQDGVGGAVGVPMRRRLGGARVHGAHRCVARVRPKRGWVGPKIRVRAGRAAVAIEHCSPSITALVDSTGGLADPTASTASVRGARDSRARHCVTH